MSNKKMKYIGEFDSVDNLRIIVSQDLKDLGIKIPKHKKSKTKEELVSKNVYFQTFSGDHGIKSSDFFPNS